MSVLIDHFKQQVRRYPDKTAIVCEKELLTYRELHDRVSLMSQILRNLGVMPGDRLGVLLPNNIDFVVVMLSAAHCGIGLVPLSPTLPPEAVVKAFRAVNVTAVTGFHAALAQLDGWEGRKISTTPVKGASGELFLAELAEKLTPGELPDYGVDDDAPYIFTMTSGSTGSPKPIVLTQRNKYLRAKAAQELYGVTAEDRVLAATPLYHSLAERLALLPLITGGTFILMPHFSPSGWMRCVEENKVTFTIAVSSQLKQIAEILTSPFTPDFASLRCIVSSSELLKNHVKRELLSKLKCEFHECYGTSEIAIATNLGNQDAARKLSSVGNAIPGVEVKVVLPDGREAPVGEAGEIICRTPMLFGGYDGLPEMTATAVRDGFFHTGDIGKMDEEGFLYFLGREKDIIITGGINVYPADVENVLLTLPGVAECAAFSLADSKLGEIVAAALVMQEGCEFNLRTAQFHCAEKLADFQIPRKFFIVEQLPRNGMGKIMKHKLREMFEQTEGS